MDSDCVGGSILGTVYHAFALEQLHNGGSVEAAHTPQVAGAFKQANILLGVEPVLAGSALRASKAEALPGTDDRWRDADLTGDFADLQIRLRGTGVGSQKGLLANAFPK